MAELEANGVRIGFDDVGEGKPIVCLGGTGMPAYAWQLAYVPALVDTGYRVVAVDGRGVGEAAAAMCDVDVVQINGFGHTDGPFGAAEHVARAIVEFFETR